MPYHAKDLETGGPLQVGDKVLELCQRSLHNLNSDNHTCSHICSDYLTSSHFLSLSFPVGYACFSGGVFYQRGETNWPAECSVHQGSQPQHFKPKEAARIRRHIEGQFWLH